MATRAHSRPCKATGTLVVYTPPDDYPRCTTRTSGNWNAVARLQNDGNFVIGASDGTPKWWTFDRSVC